jgi:hypothetical protein
MRSVSPREGVADTRATVVGKKLLTKNRAMLHAHRIPYKRGIQKF